MEVSAINETLDASKMMFATDAASKRNCIRSSNFRDIFKQVKSSLWIMYKMKSAMEMATEWSVIKSAVINEMSWNDIFDYSTKCNEMKSVV